MSKAKERAQYSGYGTDPLNRAEYTANEVQEAFIDGYHQAEKDLIDKAVGWIKEINTHHHIMRYTDSCEPPLSELIEWFKNYMKEENINSK